MIEIFDQVRIEICDNFGASLLLLIAGTVALTFIGYLLIDYVRHTLKIVRIKRRHRLEHCTGLVRIGGQGSEWMRHGYF